MILTLCQNYANNYVKIMPNISHNYESIRTFEVQDTHLIQPHTAHAIDKKLFVKKYRVSFTVIFSFLLRNII